MQALTNKNIKRNTGYFACYFALMQNDFFCKIYYWYE